MSINIEGKLAGLFGTMFTPAELWRFLRHKVDNELTQELPDPGSMSITEYASLAAGALIRRGLLTQEFYILWMYERPDRENEISALLKEQVLSTRTPADLLLQDELSLQLRRATAKRKAVLRAAEDYLAFLAGKVGGGVVAFLAVCELLAPEWIPITMTNPAMWLAGGLAMIGGKRVIAAISGSTYDRSAE